MASDILPWVLPDSGNVGGLPAPENTNETRFPIAVQGPFVWAGSDFTSAHDFTLQLSQQDVNQVKEALCVFKTFEVDGDAVDKSNFPLPTLQRRLDQAAREIHHGRGFALIRGLDPSDFSAEDNIVLFLGIASYIGDRRGIQNSDGDMLVHVTDSARWDSVPYEKRHGIHGNSSLPFHCDMGTDILALQARHVAKSGGSTYVASSWTIYNELSKADKSVVDTLCKPDWPIQVSGRDGRYILAPLIDYHEGNFLLNLDAGRLGLHPNAAALNDRTLSTIPALTPAQTEALGVVNDVAAKCALRLDLEPGDMLFINNWALIHARDSFTDESASMGRRHLIRLWLSNSELAWSIPPNMATPRQAAFGYYDHKGSSDKGIWYKGRLVQPRYPILPAREYKVPRYTAGSAAFVIDDEEGWQAFFANA